ncbi:hypothetical protein BT63DRAFT_420316 [Microthyrium microscopicum]|uniref:BZIP domain-containing protein n=1 Tax=Microthyrium microscopicum TaxID=703497 RepID=A0A6A6US19_9PEZI|nr:hypothetical protein BT63DRAFT_420316 [Microthyrium microscopicum]
MIETLQSTASYNGMTTTQGVLLAPAVQNAPTATTELSLNYSSSQNPSPTPLSMTKSNSSGPMSSRPSPDRVLKRQRNNIAAKKYRQKRIDRIEELENELKESNQEKEKLKLDLAKREAEVEMLREMLQAKK